MGISHVIENGIKVITPLSQRLGAVEWLGRSISLFSANPVATAIVASIVIIAFVVTALVYKSYNRLKTELENEKTKNRKLEQDLTTANKEKGSVEQELKIHVSEIEERKKFIEEIHTTRNTAEELHDSISLSLENLEKDIDPKSCSAKTGYRI